MTPLTAEQISNFVSTYPTTRQNEPMAAHTYLKIGGAASLFFVAETSDYLVLSVQLAEELGIPWTVIGGGSNLLVSDEGYAGVVIQAADRALSLRTRTLTAAAGCFTLMVAKSTAA